VNKTVIFGDSLSAGRIGIAYRRYIPLSTEVHGIEGDTFTKVMKRAIRHMDAKHPGRQSVIVIQGGANDLLLPHMAQQFVQWKDAVAALTAASDPPVVDDDEFSKILAELLADAFTHHPRTTMVLCSLPILGEDLSSELNQRRIARNRIMRLASQNHPNMLWCDIASPLEDLVRSGKGTSPFLPTYPGQLEMDVKTVGTDEVKAAALSSSRDLVATIDGIHPNAAGAQRIAAAISSVLPW